MAVPLAEQAVHHLAAHHSQTYKTDLRHSCSDLSYWRFCLPMGRWAVEAWLSSLT